ncbi:MAG: DUF4422 domain-containing protein [Prevotellaceae bacterium]|nr:DUF4422 domain-containing protein [Prevotellaceae bacterium]
MDSCNTKILVCCHKDGIRATEPPYMPIHVGKAITKGDLGMQGDDTGENISRKNASYCELTGMYWAWKNLRGVDVIGLCHYRRYFDFHHQVRPLMPHDEFKPEQLQTLDLSVPDSVTEKVKRGKVVTAKPLHFIHNVAMDYYTQHISDDFRTLRDVMSNVDGGRYKNAFNKVMFTGNRLSPCNMFLMRWQDFDNYCHWLFGILEEAERCIDISHYSAMQRRIFGFMAERLLNVWLYAEKRGEVLRRPLIFLCDNPRKRNWLRSLCVRLYCDCMFRMAFLENRRQAQ